MRPSPAIAALLSLATIAAVSACEVSSEGPRDRPEPGTGMMARDEAESIASGMRQNVTALIRNGAQAATGMPALYTPDAVFSDETETTYAGRQQIARAFAQGVPAGATIDIRSTGVLGSGDLVVDMGSYTVGMPNAQGGPPMRMNGRYLVVLQRMDDGSWKIVRQLTDAVGMGGALPSGPPPAADTSDTSAAPAAAAPAAAESGFTDPRP